MTLFLSSTALWFQKKCHILAFCSQFIHFRFKKVSFYQHGNFISSAYNKIIANDNFSKLLFE